MTRVFLTCSLLLLCCLSPAAEPIKSTPPLISSLDESIVAIDADLDRIPTDRRVILDAFAQEIATAIERDGNSKLNFICSHNSRRSHLSQIWAQTAAFHCGLEQIETFSGGTEATACNPRTIAALRRAGFDIVQLTEGVNPRYRVRFSKQAAPLMAFSKVYSDTTAGNPAAGFIAAMCCSEADQECPLITGSTVRIPLHYEDPKIADNTPGEAAKYDERCHQIAVEMFYVMHRVARSTRS